MTIIRHELKTARKMLIIWTAAVAFFLAICVFMYPEMKGQMETFSKMFAAMGAFTAAFGMDRLDFGSFTGFYAIECGNIMSMGGGFFAAMISANMLAKEEKEHTAEFLLSHPVSRRRILSGKLTALLLQITIMNAAAYLIAAVSTMIIGEPVPWKEISLLHGAYYLVQIELCLICFGISAFLKGNAFGIGIGITVVFYFMNIIANISKQAEFLKYMTPFGYAEGADLISNEGMDIPLVLAGLFAGALISVIGSIFYLRKDIC